MNVLQNPSFKAKIGYNGFDLSMLRKFTSTTGQLLPVYHALLMPGDKISAHVESLTRTKPLASPAMASIKERFDWFFVPMEQLYKPFGAFYYGVQDLGSNFFTEQGDIKQMDFKSFPNLVLKNLIDGFVHSHDYNVGSTPAADGFRLLEMLGYPLAKYISDISEYVSTDDYEEIDYSFLSRSYPLHILGAYQKIYFDFYRLSDRELNNPGAYNFDSFAVGGNLLDNVSELCTLRYAALNKDYFTAAQISPIFGSDNVSGFTPSEFDYGKVQQWLTGLDSVAVQDVQQLTSGPDKTTVGLAGFQSTALQKDMSKVNVANIRSMFAVDKLLEITRRSGKHYDAQTLAHFGVDVPQGINGEVLYLGGSDSRIDIGDVISTAGTETTDLGQLAGKGYGNHRGADIQFEARSHGVLMCIYHAAPEIDYYQEGLDPELSVIDRTDFVIPEFDDLGFQPLFAFQTAFNSTTNDTNLNVIRGWLPRYMAFKKKYNVVNAGLSGGLQYWTTATDPLPGNSLSNFLCRADYLNPIMLASFKSVIPASGGVIDDIYGTDPLINQVYFDVKKASKMSTFGLPNL